ncbi:hypothetical protein HK101_009823 [Irineochytrium annulatum]|nr:hypothetical protein HK101_009823 [Irineochytrium annulatum]
MSDWKARWQRSDHGEQAVNDLLAATPDWKWLLQDALDRVPATARNQRNLLKFAIKSTDEVSIKDVEDEIVDVLGADDDDCGDEASRDALREERRRKCHGLDVAAVCMARLKAFRYLDRLETFEAIHSLSGPRTTGKTPSFKRRFASFRDCDLVQFAATTAKTGDVHALEILFVRHAEEVYPFRLEILMRLPYTLEPDVPAKLLPKVDAATGAELVVEGLPWRRADWMESNQSVKEFLFGFDEEEAMSPTPSRLKREPSPASVHVLEQWYRQRISAIEKTTLQTNISLAWAELASSPAFGIASLGELRDDLMTLKDLIYGCNKPEAKLDDVSGRPVLEVINRFIVDKVAEPAAYANAMKQFVVPYLARIKRVGQQNVDGQHALESHLVSTAETNLSSCAKVFEMSREGIPASDRIIAEPTTLARLILDCAYKSNAGLNEMEVLHNLFRSMPDLDRLGANLGGGSLRPTGSGWDEDLTMELMSTEEISRVDSERISSLIQRVEVFESHLDVMELLGKHKIEVSLLFLNSAESKDAKNQKLLMVQMARSILDQGRGSEAADSEWDALLEDMIHVFSSGAFGVVEVSNIINEFLGIALGAGKFILVKNILMSSASKLSSQSAETLIVACARDFFDNADSGDMYRGYMKMALDWYVSKLSTTDVNALLDVGRKFGVASGEESGLIDVRVRAMIAEWALERSDFTMAIKSAEEMIKASQVPQATSTSRADDSWRVAVRVVREGGSRLPSQLRSHLVGFALDFCEPHSLVEVLDLSRAVEVNDLIGGDMTGALDYDVAMEMLRDKMSMADGLVDGIGGLGIPQHDFYAPVGNLDSDVYGFNFNEKRQTDVIEAILKADLIRRSMPFCNPSGAEQRETLRKCRDEDLLNLVRDVYAGGDAGLALAYLLDLYNVRDDNATSLFDSLQPSRPHDVLAMYYYSIQAFRHALGGDNSKILQLLEHQSPGHIISSAEILFDRLLSENVFHNAKVDKSIACLTKALKYASRTTSDRFDKITSSITSRADVDESRFKAEEPYRRHTLLSLSRDSLVPLDDIMLISEQFGVRKWELAAEKLKGAVQDEQFHGRDLLSLFEDVRTEFAAGTSMAFEALTALHGLLQTWNQHVGQLVSRATILENMTGKSWIRSRCIKLKSLIAMNYHPGGIQAVAEYYKKLWSGADQSVLKLQEFKTFIEQICGLRALDMFDDERTFNGNEYIFRNAGARSIFEPLYKNYVEAKLDAADWEYDEEESIVADLTELMSLLPELSGDDLVLTNLVSIMKHLNFIEQLSALEDPKTHTKLYPERIQQFDETFEAPPEQVAAICMKMVIAGTSPSLIDATCNLVAHYLSRPDLASTQAPLDALDRVIGSVLSAFPVDAAKDVDDFSDEDGWAELDAETEPVGLKQEILDVLRKNLTSVLEDADESRDSEFRLGIAKLLKKVRFTDEIYRLTYAQHFDANAVDASQLRRYKLESVTTKVWGIHPPDTLDSEEEQQSFFNDLLDKTTSDVHAKGLLDILQEYVNESSVIPQHVLELYKRTIKKLTDCNCIDVLFQLRFNPSLDGAFDSDVEGYALSRLRENRSASLKLALLSTHTKTFQKSYDTIAELLASDVSYLVGDTSLHLLLVAHNFAAKLSETLLWREVVSSLTRTTSPFQDAKMPVSLIGHAVVGLVQANRITCAADIVFTLSGLDSYATATRGLSVRLAAVRNFLRRFIAGKAYLSESAVEEPGHLVEVGAAFAFRKAVDRARTRVNAALGYQENELAIEALRRVGGEM